MKKPIFYTWPLTVLMAITIFTGCSTSADKDKIAETNVTTTNEELQQAKQQELNAEYPAFKKDAEVKIAANDKRIAELRGNLSASGKSPLDDMRRQKIDDLQKRNADLRARLYGYEKERSDWLTFKTKFNQDADKLRDAFRDFGNDLKKKD